ncbi:MAG: nucleotidyltransferase family protein [Magnetospiraceae bacterium]
MLSSAMILAAGHGLRMRPITATTPKPLISVAGQPLIAHALDRLAAAGVPRAVVNTHHLADKVEQYLRKREQPAVQFSREDVLMETGGGVKKALPLLDADAFFVMNSDILWLNGPTPALNRMMDLWDESKMDALVLVFSTVAANGYDGRGDFVIDPMGLARRPDERELTPYMFTGTQILHKRLFEDTPDTPFSLNLVYDKAIEAERLYAVIHDGECFHVGDPSGLAAVEQFMSERFPGREFRSS